MAASRVLLVDDNQQFGSQVVAAFAEAGIQADWVARGSEALSLLGSAALRPQLLIVDLVRPASGGDLLLTRLYGKGQAPAQLEGRLPLGLALVPVVGTFTDLPEGVEVQVKPIFPSQVVASARRLLGLDPTLVTVPPRSGAAAAVHRLPASGHVKLPLDTVSDQPTAAHIPQPTFDQFEDSSDFGPADTLLAPSNIEELARAMVNGGPLTMEMPLELTEDELFDGSRLDETVSTTKISTTEETTAPLLEMRRRARPAASLDANAAAGESAPPSIQSAAAAALNENGETVPLLRTVLLPLPKPAEGAAAPDAHGSKEAAALSGDLSVVPLIDVIALLARQRQSGVLRVESGALTVTLYWRNGRIDLAVAAGLAGTGSASPQIQELPDLRLGRFLRESTVLSHAQIDELARRPSRARASEAGSEAAEHLDAQSCELLGLRLCQEGLLRLDELRQALSRQTAELLYTALRWQHGRFIFDHRAALPRHATEAELGGALELDAEALLLEGHRRIHDYHLLTKDAEDGAVYVSTALHAVSGAEALEKLGLSEPELLVLGLCNGRLSLAEIAKESRLPVLEVARTVQRLLALKLCRRRLPALLAS